jgi:hypothetical protein
MVTSGFYHEDHRIELNKDGFFGSERLQGIRRSDGN